MNTFALFSISCSCYGMFDTCAFELEMNESVFDEFISSIVSAKGRNLIFDKVKENCGIFAVVMKTKDFDFCYFHSEKSVVTISAISKY